MNILLCVTGSVAASITDKTISALEEIENAKVKVAVTKSVQDHFWKPDSHVYSLKATKMIDRKDQFTDHDEWRVWDNDEEVLHIDLKNWSDVMVVAPLSANTLAKMAYGLSDNLVSTIYRAWPEEKPIVLAPAMNTDMWNNRLTKEHLDMIKGRHDYVRSKNYELVKRVRVVQPVEKKLVCGDTGIGAMAHVDDIKKEVLDVMQNHKKD